MRSQAQSRFPLVLIIILALTLLLLALTSCSMLKSLAWPAGGAAAGAAVGTAAGPAGAIGGAAIGGATGSLIADKEAAKVRADDANARNQDLLTTALTRGAVQELDFGQWIARAVKNILIVMAILAGLFMLLGIDRNRQACLGILRFLGVLIGRHTDTALEGVKRDDERRRKRPSFREREAS